MKILLNWIWFGGAFFILILWTMSIGIIIIQEFHMESVTISIILLLYFVLKRYFSLPSPKIGFVDYMPATMVVLGSGGHTWEMCQILNKLNWLNFLPTYVIPTSDSQSLAQLVALVEKPGMSTQRPYFVEKLIRPREHGIAFGSIQVAARSIICFVQSVRLIVRHRPDIILANGPSICVPLIIAGLFLKKMKWFPHLKLIFVESAARVDSISLSAKILAPFLDDGSMFGFWPNLCSKFNFRQLYSSDFEICNKKSEQIAKINKTALVTVGTTEFPDLVSIAMSSKFQEILIHQGYSQLIIQYGQSNSVPHAENSFSKLNVKLRRSFHPIAFSKLLSNVDLIITHGGAATLLEAIQLQKNVIVVPNPKTSQNHQVELAKELAAIGVVQMAETESLLELIANPNTPSSHYVNFANMELSSEFKREIGQEKIKIKEIPEKLQPQQFSIVIPCISRDVDFLCNCLTSLQEFLVPDSVSSIWIIVPSSDMADLHSLIFSKWPEWDKVKLIQESDILSNKTLTKFEKRFGIRNGWFKQQILKLKIADFIDTDFYLILDADCILTRKLDIHELICNETGRAFLQTEEMFRHPMWWRGSAKILGITDPYLENMYEGIGVTPQVLSVHLVHHLMEFLEFTHKVSSWDNLLADNRVEISPSGIWTEYTLYYLFSKRSNLLQTYHVVDAKRSLANYSKSVWEIQHAFDWSPSNFQDSSAPPFVIFQSNLNLGARIPKGFLNQIVPRKVEKLWQISSVMFVDDDTDVGNVFSSIDSFENQCCKQAALELIIVCSGRSYQLKSMQIENNRVKVMKLDEFNNYLKSDISADYICLWSPELVYSPLRLAVQLEFMQENNIGACEIIGNTTGSLFCTVDYFVGPSKYSSPMVVLHETALYQKAQISKPRKFDYFATTRKTRRIYIISSELAFTPVIGGINTWLRLIISALQCENEESQKHGFEFVFIGLISESTQPIIPNVSFKFFPTPYAKSVSNLTEYFKSFSKFNHIAADLKVFGQSAVDWIQSDAKPGDICITTIVYELDKEMINSLKSHGLKIIHTVHSLVASKALATSRCPPMNKIGFIDKFVVYALPKLVNLDEQKIQALSWLLPKFLKEALGTERHLIENADAVLVPSRKLAITTASLFPKVKQNIRYVPWGLLKAGQILGESFTGAPRPFSKNDKIHCLSLCKIIPQKGIDILLDALCLIEEIDPDLASRLHVYICGDMAYMAENQFVKGLKEKANSLTLIQIEFTGWVSGQTKVDFIAKSDLFLSPALSEPFGFSLLEAMRAGIPVVSFAAEGPSDIVKAEFGKIVQLTPSDERSKNFANGIIELCHSEEFGQHMRNAAMNTAKDWNLNHLFQNLYSI